MTAFTLIHVAISLAGIASGFVVIYGLLNSRRLDRWTAFFLATTILTSITGFLFPFERFTPGHAFGIVSLLMLGAAVYARYPKQLAGGWRGIYIVTAIISQYLNFVVLIVQSFAKVPTLTALAPTQSELPFLATQLAALAVFVAITVVALLRFHPEGAATVNSLKPSRIAS